MEIRVGSVAFGDRGRTDYTGLSCSEGDDGDESGEAHGLKTGQLR